MAIRQLFIARYISSIVSYRIGPIVDFSCHYDFCVDDRLVPIIVVGYILVWSFRDAVTLLT